MQGPLSELLAFICGIIKMLHEVICGFLSSLAIVSHMGGLLCLGCVIFCQM